MKRLISVIIITLCVGGGLLHAIDGPYIGFKGGLLLKVDVASAFVSKRVIDPEKRIENSIPTGIGYYGMADPHGFGRVLEPMAAPYGDLIFTWGYKLPRVFSFGFGLVLSNFVMPYLLFNFKFTLRDREGERLKPYLYTEIYGGVIDGFPIGIGGGGGVDIYLTKHFFLLVESKLGAEIFVSRYYDDGINSNPIWHFESTYAYASFAIYAGFGYQFKNRWTDEKGRWIGPPERRGGSK